VKRAGWIGIGVLIFVGLAGIVRTESYQAEGSALLLIGLAIALRQLTWGRDWFADPPEDR
jgi:hypothetical protein